MTSVADHYATQEAEVTAAGVIKNMNGHVTESSYGSGANYYG